MTLHRRRTVLVGLASTAALAGCFENTGENGEPEPEPESEPEPEPEPEPEEDEEETPEPDDPEDAFAPEDTTPIAQFQYDAQNTGVVDTTAPEDGDPQWQTLFRTSDVGLAVTNQQVIPLAGAQIGSLNRADGTEQWRVMPYMEFRSLPTVTSDTAYVTAIDGKEFSVAAIATDAGGVRWGTLDEFSSSSSPVVTDETVFVAGTQDDTTVVVALDATTGEEVWRTSFEDAGNIDGPAVSEEMIYITASVSTDDDNEDKDPAMIVALDQDDGDEMWRADITLLPSGSPTVHDGVVYVGTYESPVDPEDGTVWAMDAANGEPVWSVDLDGGVAASVAVTDNAIYVPGGQFFTALTHEGDTLWQDSGYLFHAPTVTSDAIIATDWNDIICYEPDGEERWRFEPESRETQDGVRSGIRSPPFVSDGSVYMISHAGYVYEF